LKSFRDRRLILKRSKKLQGKTESLRAETVRDTGSKRLRRNPRIADVYEIITDFYARSFVELFEMADQINHHFLR
jgi:hypothetical protein